jgi:hypothetical protein
MLCRELEGITAACDNWQQRTESFLLELEHQEHQLQQRSQALCADLFTECQAYRGLTKNELESLIASECEILAADRHRQVVAQLSALFGGIRSQSRNWRLAAEALAGFRVERVVALELQETDGNALEKGVRKTLKVMQAEHTDANSKREALLAAAIASVEGASSEEELDRRVKIALEILADIEAAHRAAHSNLVAIVASHPNAVRAFHASYSSSLCRALCLGETLADAASSCGKEDGLSAEESLGGTKASDAVQETAVESTRVFGPALEPISLDLEGGKRMWQRTADLLLSILESAEAKSLRSDASGPRTSDTTAPATTAGDGEQHAVESVEGNEAQVCEVNRTDAAQSVRIMLPSMNLDLDGSACRHMAQW